MRRGKEKVREREMYTKEKCSHVLISFKTGDSVRGDFICISDFLNSLINREIKR